MKLDIENIENLSKEELLEIRKEYSRLKDVYHNQEQAIKRILNSIYGAFGNKWFYFFNIAIAESITLQGQDAILYTEKILNKYFTEFWHRDKEAHEKMGITVTRQAHKPAVVYIDTDSCYVQFEELMDSCKWEGTERDFILQLYEYRLKDYIIATLDKYSEKFGTENYQSFELESIATSGIFLAKKKYLQDIVWTDPDLYFDPLSKIKVKGWDTVQASCPITSREILQGALKLIFKDKNVNLDEIVEYLKEQRKLFKLQDIDDLSLNMRMNNYDKYVLDDVNQLTLAKGAGPNIKGAALYNYLLNNSDHKIKYSLLTEGERMKMYYSAPEETFCYSSNEFPYEFAPKIDYDVQFEKSIIDPLNRIFTRIGVQQLNRNLMYAQSLF